MPLLANLFGLPLPVLSRAEEFFGNSAQLGLQSWQFERLSGESVQLLMAYLGVFKFDRVFARSAFFRHPATEARTAIGADFYLTNKKRIPRQRGGH